MAKTEMDKNIDAIFASDVRTGKLALVTMAKLVTDLAETRNSDPMRRFISKARNHHHNNFALIITKLIRLYFGDKMVIAGKDDTHPTGTSIKLKFSGNPKPKNTWSLVVEAIQKQQAYNDRTFIKKVNEMLAPEKVDPIYEQQVVKVQARVLQDIKFLTTVAKDVSFERYVAELRQAWKDETGGITVGRNPTTTTATPETNIVDIDDKVFEDKAA